MKTVSIRLPDHSGGCMFNDLVWENMMLMLTTDNNLLLLDYINKITHNFHVFKFTTCS